MRRAGRDGSPRGRSSFFSKSTANSSTARATFFQRKRVLEKRGSRPASAVGQSGLFGFFKIRKSRKSQPIRQKVSRANERQKRFRSQIFGPFQIIIEKENAPKAIKKNGSQAASEEKMRALSGRKKRVFSQYFSRVLKSEKETFGYFEIVIIG